MTLSFVDVGFCYVTDTERIEVLSSVGFTVAPGEVVAIEGRSGSGKSTVLNLAAGVLPVQEGSVCVDGAHLETLDEAARTALRLHRVGVVFQDGTLFPGLSVLDNVALPVELQGVERSEARSEALGLLDRLGMGEFADRAPRELSGGQRQRVAIARGLVGDRCLLLVDEPTAALDTTTSRVVMDALTTAAHGGAAVLVATHDPVVVEHADRVVALADGRICPPNRD